MPAAPPKKSTPGKVPTLVITKIRLLQEKLACVAIQPYEGKRLIGDDFKTFVSKLHDEVPKVPYSTLLDSVQHLAGQLITPEANKELSWRLAGNLHHLRKGVIVPPYSRQLFPEWVAVQVWDVTRKMGWRYLGNKKLNNKVLKPEIEMDLLALAGTPAGRTFKFKRAESIFRNRNIKQLLGFTPYDKRLWNRYFVGDNNYPMQSIQELVKLRFFVFLDPLVSKAGEAEYGEITCTGSMRKWNRALMKKRQRQGFACPMKYELAQTPCHHCEKGFDFCSAACHPSVWTKRFCTGCQSQAWFANHEAEWCVDCSAKRP